MGNGSKRRGMSLSKRLYDSYVYDGEDHSYNELGEQESHTESKVVRPKRRIGGVSMRDIIDQVVRNNRGRDPERYKILSSYIKYKGKVSDPDFRFTDSVNPSMVVKNSLLGDLKTTIDSIERDPGVGTLIIGGETYSGIDQNIIWLIKGIIIKQVNPSSNYGQLLSSYVTELMNMVSENSIVMPIVIPTNNNYQEVLLSELNDFCIGYFDDNGIPYGSVITVKNSGFKEIKPKKGKSALDTLAGMANEKD